MKSYTIGREETCNIVIADSSQMVSRLHATLTLDGSKMTITDSSSNGTYINGIRIASGTAVPVTRKDVVSFAQVAELDWAQIPNPGKRTLWIALAVVAVLAAAGCGYWFFQQDRKAGTGRCRCPGRQTGACCAGGHVEIPGPEGVPGC